ncbi:MAG TPA: RpiB/LacA/LacB family sugar-phosphate isomerase [Solirubrobacteraceae bacterium]|nr:RpiB/LacA/LacB family sugar-phosphate isomerase [Solirubrobacteraceae bacterium]
MRISIAADERVGVAGELEAQLRDRGHEVLLHGALARDERHEWAWASEAVARDVAEGRAGQGVVACWTGTGASIAANKVTGVRAALCFDAATAAGARRWNDANVLALSLRSTSQALLEEILDAWFSMAASAEADDLANVAYVDALPGVSAGVEIAPQLAVHDGIAAVQFYRDAFGAVELYRVGGSAASPELVVQLAVGATTFWVADESPEHESFSPALLGGGTVKMLLDIADPDEIFARALRAGAREVRPMQDEHGWRLGRIEDPFGHHWEIGRPLEGWPPAHEPRSG